jgi:hypothetical protein
MARSYRRDPGGPRDWHAIRSWADTVAEIFAARAAA